MKSEDVVLLDLRKLTVVADFFVICGSPSTVGVKAIAEEILHSLRDEGVRPNHVEGMNEGTWVLIDYSDVIVHVFHDQIREYFDLESLWGDASQKDFRLKPRKKAKKKSKTGAKKSKK